MRRADRLFQIIQLLRRTGQPLTAEAIAAELETSKRTVYRDIAALMGQRVPIRGEAGIGYVLDAGFDLPPLMLTAEEIEAAVLGAQWVAANGDHALARAATDLFAKIGAIVPDKLRSYVFEPATTTSPNWKRPSEIVDVALLRSWCQRGRKVSLLYEDEHGRASQRVVWPFLVGYRDASRALMAWCELRRDFRMFRLDRMRQVEFLDERYPERRSALHARWSKQVEERRRAWQTGQA